MRIHASKTVQLNSLQNSLLNRELFEELGHLVPYLNSSSYSMHRKSGGWVRVEPVQVLLQKNGEEPLIKVHYWSVESTGSHSETSYGIKLVTEWCHSKNLSKSFPKVTPPAKGDRYGIDFGGGVVPVELLWVDEEKKLAYFVDPRVVEKVSHLAPLRAHTIELFVIPSGVLHWLGKADELQTTLDYEKAKRKQAEKTRRNEGGYPKQFKQSTTILCPTGWDLDSTLAYLRNKARGIALREKTPEKISHH